MTLFQLHQRLRYDYPSPIRDLCHRLVVIPPEGHGGQRRVSHRVEVHGADAELTANVDGFGNHVIDVRAGHVERAIEFEAWAVVERVTDSTTTAVPFEALGDRRFGEFSPLTLPDAGLDAAARLLNDGRSGLDLARSIMGWVHQALLYVPDCTGVRTTAADALGLGAGVCQDYAHVMLALCRLCGVPARYVSGHLRGEGGTHAWVEVLVPAAGRPGEAVAVALDPTHDCEAGPGYLTIAVGRDYFDVAPTSGTFTAPVCGRLSSRKVLADLALAS